MLRSHLPAVWCAGESLIVVMFYIRGKLFGSYLNRVTPTWTTTKYYALRLESFEAALDKILALATSDPAIYDDIAGISDVQDRFYPLEEVLP